MKIKKITIYCLSFFLISVLPIEARQLIVGKGGDYKSSGEAALIAKPGDTIMIKTGFYQGGEVINNLRGTEKAWIIIMAEVPGKTCFMSAQAFHFRDPAYVKIIGFVFSQLTGNGVNIDDGGTPESPAHHVIIENCIWTEVVATGNFDALKISGLNDFEIRNCQFLNGSGGGSLIDMVGCHRGIIENNLFGNGGSNSIQAKGGTEDLIIRRNRFENGGERAINIGGSTGLQYFRPLGARFEASGIKVWTNIFTGGIVPVAFVGAVNCEVINNTIINPEKWVLRILQENRTEGMLQCGKNTFRNNIIVFTTSVSVPVNIGPGTDPASFIFSNNLWYLSGNNSWTGPELPVKETGQVLNAGPLFIDDEYRLKSSSPAIGSGFSIPKPEADFFGRNFASKRAIGAIEF